MHDGLRLLLDSGATYHVCPKGFVSEFALDDSQDTLDELPVLHAAMDRYYTSTARRMCLLTSEMGLL